ncbi:Xaa-Pro peptidase family protein [Fodinicurvata sp. EGI_FJ10296]|uniref:M24 family metallopeptidase n=1 Tax=Fodinicurvata sp. EGI_FJ10296 TaxID=3231908 RepID=UPI003454A44C
MALHFTTEEFESRQHLATGALIREGLDGLLVFRQESHYWLSGYDTFGYVYFQCLLLTADGRMVLLTRAPDRLQARLTSCVDDIRIWIDGPDADPAGALASIVAEYLPGQSRPKLGVEYEAYGLTGRNAKRLEAAFDSRAYLSDASELVSRLRLVKSPAEIACLRRAAALSDAAFAAGLDETRAGAFEGDILAAMHGAIYRGDGDDPANEFIIGSGPEALMCRYHSGRRHLDTNDQLTLEWAGVFRHYHAAMMNTVIIGSPPPEQIAMHAAARDALLAVEAALSPGNTAGDAFDAHTRVLDAAGYQAHRMNACGYGQGTTFAPNWMDWPMLYHANPVQLQPGMAFFVHIIVFDSDKGLAMSLGRTSLITASGAEPLSTTTLDLIQR